MRIRFTATGRTGITAKSMGFDYPAPFWAVLPKRKRFARNKKKLARQDEIDRIPVEGKFGQGKRRFGLARIMAKLEETSLTVIGMNLLAMNLEKMSRLLSWKRVFLLIHLWMVRIYRAVQAGIKAKWRCCLNLFWQEGSFRLLSERCTIEFAA